MPRQADRLRHGEAPRERAGTWLVLPEVELGPER